MESRENSKKPWAKQVRLDLTSGIREYSTLPGRTFESVASDLEDSIDQGATEIILNYLAMESPHAVEPEEHAQLRTEEVSGSELKELAVRLSTEQAFPTPDLMENWEHERLWILSDSTLNGTCTEARALAAELLRLAMESLDVDNMDIEVSERLIRVLAPDLIREPDRGEGTPASKPEGPGE